MINSDSNTKTQILRLIDNIKVKHDTLKKEIINHTYEIETIEKTINTKIIEIDELEKNYIELVEKLYE